MKRRIWMPTLIAGVLTMGAPVLTLAAASGNGSAVQLLIERAQYWKMHGREDLAAKSWEQVLAADPKQPTALAGLALYDARRGRLAEAQRYLDRLKQVAPQNPAIDQIRGLLVLGPGAGPKLAEAARLTSEKRYAAAVSAYRNVFQGPPPPKWAETYYQTLAKVPGGWQTAVSELRTQVTLHPHETAYRLVLGQLLSYHAQTRIEGIKILSSLAKDKVPGAQAHWREALGWMGKDPRAIPYLRAYLAKHRDSVLAANLRQAEGLQAGIVRQRRHGREMSDAYAALKAGHLNRAREMFTSILTRDPHNAKAQEGLADVAMRAQDFTRAADYYGRAEGMTRSAADRARLAKAARNARYWSWMKAGQQAVAVADYQRAVNDYRQALNLKSEDPAALAALGGAYQRMGQSQEASRIFARLTKAAPDDPKAWLAALQSLQQMDSPAQLLAANRRIPDGVKRDLQGTPDYASVVAWAEAATGHRPEAIARLRAALARDGKAAPVDLQLQLAWLLYQSDDDVALHTRLIALLGRQDLTSDQSDQVRSLYLNAARREAQHALDHGNTQIAEAIVSGAESIYPNDPGVQRVRADLLIQEGHFSEALTIYRQVGPGKTSAGYQAAVGAALAAGDTAQAQKWVRQGLASRPDDVSLKMLAAKVDLRQGNADMARKSLRSALASLPEPVLPASETMGGSVAANGFDKRYPFAAAAPAQSYPFAGPVGAKVAATGPLPEVKTGVAMADVPKARQEIRDELAAIEGHMSPYVDAAFYARARSGTQGLDQMTLFGSQFEGSTAVDYNTRVTVRLAPIAVDAGTVSSGAKIGTAPIYGPEPGTYAKASGLGLAMSLDRPNLGITVGSSPLGFLEHSLIASLRWQPSGGPLALDLFRHAMRDSVLSYAGIKDQKTGLVWGGVFVNGLGISFGSGNEERLLYGSLSLAALEGQHVQTNTRVEANLGANWRIVDQREARIALGFDLLSMFYSNDSSHFTYGQGGYFSPQYYFRPALTLKWQGTAAHRLNYRFNGLVGWQVFHSNSSKYFPLDSGMQTLSGNAYYPSNTVGSVAYGLKFTGTYAWTPHLFISGFFGSDNSQNYTNLSGGVLVRYWFNAQPLDRHSMETHSVEAPWLFGLNNPQAGS